MDIKKLQEIIDSSQLSPEAKDLILDLIPDIDKPGVQEEILKTIDYEIKMYGLDAEEFEAVDEELQAVEKKLDAADAMEDEQLAELGRKYEEKMVVAEEEMKQATEYKDKLINALTPSGDSQPATDQAEAPQTQLNTDLQTPVATVAVEPATQNPGYGGQQYNAGMPVQTPVQTQPAAFPTAPVVGE